MRVSAGVGARVERLEPAGAGRFARPASAMEPR